MGLTRKVFSFGLLACVLSATVSAHAQDYGRLVGDDHSRYERPFFMQPSPGQDAWRMMVEREPSVEELKLRLKWTLDEIKTADGKISNCPKNVSAGARVLFAFEGFKSENLNKAIAYHHFPAWDLDDEIVGFYCTLPKFKPSIASACAELKRAIRGPWTGIGGHPYLLEYLLAPYLGQAEFSDIRWIYSPHWAVEERVKCAQTLYKKDPTVRLFIVGHSYGGYGALEMAAALDQDKIPVQGLFTVDAVPRKFSANETPLLRPLSVKRFYNAYQLTDTRSLRIAGIKGVPIAGADAEIKIEQIRLTSTYVLSLYFAALLDIESKRAIEDSRLGKTFAKTLEDYAHIYLPRTREVHTLFLQMLREL